MSRLYGFFTLLGFFFTLLLVRQLLWTVSMWLVSTYWSTAGYEEDWVVHEGEAPRYVEEQVARPEDLPVISMQRPGVAGIDAIWWATAVGALVFTTSGAIAVRMLRADEAPDART